MSQDIITKRSLEDLLRQCSPNERLDQEVADILLELSEDFIDSVTNGACDLALHRGSKSLELKDVALQLETNWNICLPGYAVEDVLRLPSKRQAVQEARRKSSAQVKKPRTRGF